MSLRTRISNKQVSLSEKSTQIKDKELITNAAPKHQRNQEVGCGICYKAFMGTAALNNHVKIVHFNEYENSDADSWTCSISEVNRIRRATKDRGPREQLIDDISPYVSKEEVISAMSPGKLTALVPENVQYIIMKNEDDEQFTKRKRKNLEFPSKRSSSVDDPDEESLQKSNDVYACCDECGGIFANRYTLKNHKKMKHFLDEEKINLMCEICGKICSSESTLKQHQLYHSCKKLYPCTECDKSYTTSHQLKSHQISHENKRHTCHVCGKLFAKKKELDIHSMIHTLPRPYQCQLCPHNFTQDSSLKIHMNAIHNKNMKFRCKMCDKSFDELCPYKLHVETAHLKIKEFTCKLCNMSFSRLNTLSIHEQMVHDNREKSAVVIENDK